MADILDGLLGETPEAESAPVVQAPEDGESGGPARGADGKFVSAKAEEPPQAEAPPAPEPAPAAPVQAAPEPTAPPAGFVPLSVVHGLRDEMKELRAKLDTQQAPRQQQAPAEPPPPPPSVFEDEAAYNDYQTQKVQQAVTVAVMNVLEDSARAKHGDDVIDNLNTWFGERSKQSPAFHQEVMSQRNPYEYALTRMQREEALAQVNTDEFAQFKAWQAAQAQADGSAQIPAAIAPAAIAPPPTPTRSLASASSAGGAAHVPTGPGQAFDQTFK